MYITYELINANTQRGGDFYQKGKIIILVKCACIIFGKFLTPKLENKEYALTCGLIEGKEKAILIFITP